MVKPSEIPLRKNKIYHNYSPKQINKIFKLSDDNPNQNPEKVLDYLEKHLLKTSNFKATSCISPSTVEPFTRPAPANNLSS